MHETILEQLAKRAPRLRDDDESRLHAEIKKTLSKIKSKKTSYKYTKSSRGGLASMGARGVFLKENDIYSRRVVVKASYVTSKDEKSRSRIRHHLNYAGRNTQEEEKKAQVLYSNVDERVSIKNKIDDFEKAPHIFNIIISPEEGDKLDLKEFTRDLVKTVEIDLRTKLDWVAGNHFDTNEPHVHLLIKGLDDGGKKLLMTRDYISRGLRIRASQTANKKLGLRSLDDVVASLKLDITKPKKCAIDDIITKNIKEGLVNPAKIDSDALDDLPRSLIERRLEFLASKELAERVDGKDWRIKEGFIDELRNIERSTSIITKLSGGLKIDKLDCEVLSVKNIENRTIKGHIVERGYVDDLSNQEYLLVKSKEKAFIYVELEKYSERSPASVGEFVQIDATKPFAGPKTSDLTINKIAQENGGIYDGNDHEKKAHHKVSLPPGVSAREYAQVHVNRLEVLAKQGIVEKLSEGRYSIPKDYLEKLSFEAKKSKEGHKPHIKVTRLSPTKISKPNLGRRIKQ